MQFSWIWYRNIRKWIPIFFFVANNCLNLLTKLVWTGPSQIQLFPFKGVGVVPSRKSCHLPSSFPHELHDIVISTNQVAEPTLYLFAGLLADVGTSIPSITFADTTPRFDPCERSHGVKYSYASTKALSIDWMSCGYGSIYSKIISIHKS